MGMIGAIVFGLIAGMAAKMLMPGKDPGGCILTSILGIVGAVVGKLVSQFFGGEGDVTRWTMHGFALSVLGAIIVLFIYRMIAGRKS